MEAIYLCFIGLLLLSAILISAALTIAVVILLLHLFQRQQAPDRPSHPFGDYEAVTPPILPPRPLNNLGPDNNNTGNDNRGYKTVDYVIQSHIKRGYLRAQGNFRQPPPAVTIPTVNNWQPCPTSLHITPTMEIPLPNRRPAEPLDLSREIPGFFSPDWPPPPSPPSPLLAITWERPPPVWNQDTPTRRASLPFSSKVVTINRRHSI